jgi:sugar O-acyltransferase (sialic acid O-acetyltransferase NeuD family)
MAEPLVVVGAGGFGREVVDVVEAINADAGRVIWELLGIVDDGPSPDNLERLTARGVPHLGDVTDFLAGDDRPAYVVGIGAPPVRRALSESFDAAGLSAATLVHPAATTGFGVELGEGTVVCAGARLTTNIRVGRHAHINPNVTVGHDTVVGDFVSLNPASSVSGECSVGDGVLIGVGAVVLNRVSIGAGTTVGAAACVVTDAPAGVVLKGVPAR